MPFAIWLQTIFSPSLIAISAILKGIRITYTYHALLGLSLHMLYILCLQCLSLQRTPIYPSRISSEVTFPISLSYLPQNKFTAPIYTDYSIYYIISSTYVYISLEDCQSILQCQNVAEHQQAANTLSLSKRLVQLWKGEVFEGEKIKKNILDQMGDKISSSLVSMREKSVLRIQTNGNYLICPWTG